MLKGFKDFLFRGNIVDLAVAVVIGTAFTALVTSFTKSFLEPLIAVLGGGGEAGGTFSVNGVVFTWGAFINAIITFILTAAVVYFVVVIPMKKILERAKRNDPIAEAAEPAITDTAILTEIRDLLKAQQTGGATSAVQLPPQL